MLGLHLGFSFSACSVLRSTMVFLCSFCLYFLLFSVISCIWDDKLQSRWCESEKSYQFVRWNCTILLRQRKQFVLWFIKFLVFLDVRGCVGRLFVPVMMKFWFVLWNGPLQRFHQSCGSSVRLSEAPMAGNCSLLFSVFVYFWSFLLRFQLHRVEVMIMEMVSVDKLAVAEPMMRTWKGCEFWVAVCSLVYQVLGVSCALSFLTCTISLFKRFNWNVGRHRSQTRRIWRQVFASTFSLMSAIGSLKNFVPCQQARAVARSTTD